VASPGVGPDGNLYVNYATNILRYNGATGEFLNEFVGGLPMAPLAPAFQGQYAYVGGGSGPVLKYDATSGSFIGPFIPQGAFRLAESIVFAPDGSMWCAKETLIISAISVDSTGVRASFSMSWCKKGQGD